MRSKIVRVTSLSLWKTRSYIRIRNETAESDRNVDGGLFSCVGIKSVGCFRRALWVTPYVATIRKLSTLHTLRLIIDNNSS